MHEQAKWAIRLLDHGCRYISQVQRGHSPGNVGRCSGSVELGVIKGVSTPSISTTNKSGSCYHLDLPFQLQKHLTELIATYPLEKYLRDLDHDLQRRYETKVHPTAVRHNPTMPHLDNLLRTAGSFSLVSLGGEMVDVISCGHGTKLGTHERFVRVFSTLWCYFRPCSLNLDCGCDTPFD